MAKQKRNLSPKQLANLRPFVKGEPSGNPKGRPRTPAGLTLREWLNEMVDKTETQIREILEDPKASAAKIIAAQRVLNAMQDSAMYREKNGELFRVGDTPGPALDFDRIMDRTEGKPAQTVNANVQGTMTLQLTDEDRAKLEQIAKKNNL